MQSYAQQIKEVTLPKIQKELNLKNVMSVPRLQKIIVNVGIGTRMKTTKDYSDVVENVEAITGQKPVVTMSKKAISNFKLRADYPSGIVTTLRRGKMLDFFNRMVNVAFPRIRDFQGFSDKAFDGKGNYSIGIKDITIFPEVRTDDLSNVHGMSITIVTSGKNDEEARSLLRNLNFPFKKPVKKESPNKES
jgi:large subunit ribosomal protein L5